MPSPSTPFVYINFGILPLLAIASPVFVLVIRLLLPNIFQLVPLRDPENCQLALQDHPEI